MSPDDYECIMVAAKLAEFNKTRGFFISLRRLEDFLAGHWFATCNSTVQFDVDLTLPHNNIGDEAVLGLGILRAGV